MQLTTSFKDAFKPDLRARYRWVEVRNASSIMRATAPKALAELTAVLDGFDLTAGDLLNPGGSKSATAIKLDEAFRKTGWRETHLTMSMTGVLKKQGWSQDPLPHGRKATESKIFFEGQTHKVDNFRDRLAIEVEWNAKDGNLDRDLSAFRALYDAGVIDAAAIITRHHSTVFHASNWLAHELHRVNFKGGKEVLRYSTTTTTNLEKLVWRLQRGDAGGCPVLAVGISRETYTPGRLWMPPGGAPAVTQPVIPPMGAAEEEQLSVKAAGGDPSMAGDDEHEEAES